MARTYKGEIKARIINVRFASSGKISNVAKKTGDSVKKWNLLASLDRKILQTELDSQLADFEKVRADFEIFNQKNPNPESAIDKYSKTEKQASLNASVKQVELAKARLDQVDIFSPVDGIILDDGEVAVGIYTTPSASAFSILDINSYYFEFEISQKEIPNFVESQKCKIKIEGVKDNVESSTNIVLSDGKKFMVRASIPNSSGAMLGMVGAIEISN